MSFSLTKTAYCVVIVASLLINDVNADSESPKIKEMQGTVTLQQQDTQDWKPVEAGDELSLNDTLKTGEDSTADVVFDLVNLFRLQPVSEMQVKSLPDAAGGDVVQRLYNFSLISGGMVAKLDKLPESTRFEVETPVAIAGARGTAFAADTTKQGCQFIGLENEIEIRCTQDTRKQVVTGPYRQVLVAPWEQVELVAVGTGVLSEAILGKMTSESMDLMYIRAEGTAADEQQARRVAEDNIAQILTEIKVGPEKNIADMLFTDTSLAGKLYELVARSQPVETRTNDDGSVTVVLELRLEQIQQLVNEKLNVWKSIREISRSEYMQEFPAVARVTTERAAKLDAYRRLAEKIYGTVLTSDTKVRDLTLEKDTITSVVEGMVQGAKVVATQYFSDGSVKAVMAIDGTLVENRLSAVSGQDMGAHYVSSPELMPCGDYRYFAILKEME